MLNIILFGPPGAGKGTQSEKLIEKYQLTHIATGDLFRMHMGENTELGQLAKQYINEGNLVPDSLVIKMVEDKIGSSSGASGFIFDGFPRTVAQAVALDEMLNEQNMPISIMLALEVEDDELRNRIRLRGKTSGRADDQNDTKIDNRINVYKEETLPVAEHYNQQSKYKGVQGIGDIEDIFKSLCTEIDTINH